MSWRIPAATSAQDTRSVKQWAKAARTLEKLTDSVSRQRRHGHWGASVEAESLGRLFFSDFLTVVVICASYIVKYIISIYLSIVSMISCVSFIHKNYM